jgi:hypothetical protein
MFFLRDYILEIPSWMNKVPVGDMPVCLILGVKGNIGYLNDIMAVYRIASSIHSWSYSMSDFRKRKIHYYAIQKMWKDFDEWTFFKYHTYVEKRMLAYRLKFYKSFFISLIKRKKT